MTIVVFIIMSREFPDSPTADRIMVAAFHGVAEICTIGKNPATPRNVANLLIRPASIVWLVINCSSLVILVILYNVANLREELNF